MKNSRFLPAIETNLALADAVLNTTGARRNLACLNAIPLLQVGSFQGDLREFLSSGNDEDDNPVDEIEEGDEERG